MHFHFRDSHKLAAIRVVRPMISSVEEDSHHYNEKYRITFWNLGKQPRNKARRGTISDKAQKLYEPDDQEDNFDILRATSEKMALLRPILEPEVYNPLLVVLRKRAAPILSKMINSLYPINSDEGENIVCQNNAKIQDEVPDWAKEFSPDGGGAGSSYVRIIININRMLRDDLLL